MRKLGKKEARTDHRIAKLADRLDVPSIVTPDRVAWHAMLPPDGIGMLGNDKYGCCVEATVCHMIQQMALYNNKTLTPTEEECLQIYSDVTGFNKNILATDQGTYWLGPGGMVEHWATKGVVVGGELNKCGPVVSVDWKNPVELQTAIYLFGFIPIGEELFESDQQSNLWLTQSGKKLGGHKSLLTGYLRTPYAVRYTILTWDELIIASDDWITNALDECSVVWNDSFLSDKGVSPASVDRVALQNDLALFG